MARDIIFLTAPLAPYAKLRTTALANSIANHLAPRHNSSYFMDERLRHWAIQVWNTVYEVTRKPDHSFGLVIDTVEKWRTNHTVDRGYRVEQRLVGKTFKTDEQLEAEAWSIWSTFHGLRYNLTDSNCQNFASLFAKRICAEKTDPRLHPGEKLGWNEVPHPFSYVEQEIGELGLVTMGGAAVGAAQGMIPAQAAAAAAHSTTVTGSIVTYAHGLGLGAMHVAPALMIHPPLAIAVAATGAGLVYFAERGEPRDKEWHENRRRVMGEPKPPKKGLRQRYNEWEAKFEAEVDDLFSW